MSSIPESDAGGLPAVLTIEEVSRILRIGRSAGYEAARRGDIPTIRVGRRILVPRAALERMLADTGSGGRTPCDRP